MFSGGFFLIRNYNKTRGMVVESSVWLFNEHPLRPQMEPFFMQTDGQETTISACIGRGNVVTAGKKNPGDSVIYQVLKSSFRTRTAALALKSRYIRYEKAGKTYNFRNVWLLKRYIWLSCEFAGERGSLSHFPWTKGLYNTGSRSRFIPNPSKLSDYLT